MSRQVTRELELKFLLPATFELPALTSAGGPAVSATDEQRMTLVAVYYDTADLRLARQGITLRRRSGGGDDGWHLKLPSRGAAHDRSEIASSSRADTIPEELAELVTVHRRLSPLIPAATLVTDRRSHTLLDAAGRPLADVVDDWVSVESVDRVTAPFREVEVEDRGGGEEFLSGIAERLAQVGAGPADFLPKAVRALGPRAVSPPEPLPASPLKKRSPAALVVELLLRSEVRLVMEIEPRVRLGSTDALDAIHASLERLRTGLRLLRPLVERDWADEVRAELGWLIFELAASEPATTSHRLAMACETLPADLVLGAVRSTLTKRVGDEARGRQARALVALRDPRWPALLDRLVAAGASPPTTRPAQRACRDVLPDLLAYCWRDLHERGDSLSRPGPKVEDCPRALAATRRLHLALTLSASVLGKPGRRLARAVSRLQVALEERAAAQRTCAAAVALAGSPRIGATAFTFGVLYERELSVARGAARETRRAWHALVTEQAESRISTR